MPDEIRYIYVSKDLYRAYAISDIIIDITNFEFLVAIHTTELIFQV